MRTPPPVEFVSGLGRAWRGVLTLLVAAAVASPLAWGLPFVGMTEPTVQAACALAAGALAGTLYGRRLARSAGPGSACVLRWDGRLWTLTKPAGAELPGDVRLMLDLGPWLLVHFQPCSDDGRQVRLRAGVWLPLTLTAEDAARGSALRDALWNWRPERPPEPEKRPA